MTTLDPQQPAGVDDRAVDLDQPEDDSLLGVPLRHFMQVRSLRGLTLVGVALTILLWPGRSSRVLGVLMGAALAVYAVTTAVDLARDRSRRRFVPVLSVGAAGGLAAALVTQPDEALTSAAQAVGGMMIVAAVATIGLMLARRHTVAWGIAKAVALTIGGVLLLVFPDTLLIAAASVAAGAAVAVGLIEVFTPQAEQVRPADHLPAADDTVSITRRSVMRWIQRRPPEAEERSSLQEKLFFEGDTSAVRFARFIALMLFASIIASIGVVVESTAVVIGAMLIAPLMIPLMGTAYGVTMGWLRRVRRCAGIALVGIFTGIATGAVVGAVVPRTVDVTTNTEILARIAPTILDLGIAVAAGAAGAYALTRRDVSDSLPGVAVAISLVPPLTVVGLCWQQAEWAAGNGALLLFLTNAIAILVAGGTTFVLVGAAPLHRVSESQERWATVIVSVVSLAAIVLLLLMLNGASVAQREVSINEVDDVVATWTEQNPDYHALDTRAVDDDTIVVDLAGPGEPPGLDALLADLDEAVEDGVKVRVTWIEQNQVTIGDA